MYWEAGQNFHYWKQWMNLKPIFLIYLLNIRKCLIVRIGTTKICTRPNWFRQALRETLLRKTKDRRKSRWRIAWIFLKVRLFFFLPLSTIKAGTDRKPQGYSKLLEDLQAELASVMQIPSSRIPNTSLMQRILLSGSAFFHRYSWEQQTAGRLRFKISYLQMLALRLSCSLETRLTLGNLG